MEITVYTVACTALAAFIGGTIQGTVAFGMGIFMVTALAWLFPASSLVPFVTLAAGVNLVELARCRGVHWRSLSAPVLLVPSFVGTAVGTMLLVYVPDWGVKTALGIVVASTGIVFLLRPPRPLTQPTELHNELREPWAVRKAGATFLGSILGGWISTGGPPMILYGYATMPPASAQRYLVRGFLVGISIKLMTYGYYNLWTTEVVLWALGSVGFVLLGTRVGHSISTRLSTEFLTRAVWILFCCMGLGLLIRSIATR